jgi:aryl-alcohol dehydrogenase-like predicted oxidoreductase
MSKLVLGTASLKEGYGVARSKKSKSLKEIEIFIKTAQQLGINDFDTAPSYGSAEVFLGSFLDKSTNPKISSKLTLTGINHEEIIRKSVEQSLENLQISTIETLYLHDESSLLREDGQELFSALKRLQSDGFINKIGVSAYSLKVLQDNFSQFPNLDAFQVPENICDRRLLHSSYLSELHLRNKTLIIRSIFLQGLLLMDPKSIPLQLRECKDELESLHSFAKGNNLKTLDMCLAYARAITWCDGVLIGAQDVAQLTEIANSDHTLPDGWEKSVMRIVDGLIDPRNWKNEK